MRSIRIEDDVYRHIQSLAIPFEETEPNQTLKRFFGLDATASAPAARTAAIKRSRPAVRRKPKANLQELVASGALSEGQKLTLTDYSGNVLDDYSAVISGTNLVYEGRTYSMSALANRLLNDLGYTTSSTRGPTHWVTTSGKSIKTFWDEYLHDQ